MARSLKDRLVAEIGRRKICKYFPDDQEDGSGDQEILAELVDEGLRELGEILIITADEDLVVTDSQIDISPIGRTAPRRLAVDEVWYDGASDGIPVVVPRYIPTFVDGVPTSKAGWKAHDQKLFLRNLSYEDGTTLRVSFAVAPLESEIESAPDLMRAASLFAAAGAFERIAGIAQREHTIRMEGVPDIRDEVTAILKNVETLRERARRICGAHMAVF